MTQSRQRGFTLLEVLIALAIMVVLIVLLNQGFGFGLRATAMQAGVKEKQGDLDMVDRALRRLIARADPGQFPEPATLRGAASSVSLTTDLPVTTDGAPQRVAATLMAVDGQLRLRWTRLRHVESFGPAPPVQDTLVLDGVSALQLAYFPVGGSAWTSSWTADKLPALVRIQIAFAKPGRHWPPIITAPVREPLEE